MSQSLARNVAAALSSADRKLSRIGVLVGLDGFVDTILHVVDKRESVDKYTRLTRMTEFGKRIQAAAGDSANMEMVTQMVKLGGNGPIMANALGSFGFGVQYIGNLGEAAIHPVFDDFARMAKVTSIADPGFTDAVEFDDGKLMFGKHETLRDVNWKNLISHLPEEKLVTLFGKMSLLAFVNWTMLVELDGILKKLVTRVMPKLKGKDRRVFFDLADPAKRTREDIASVLKTISRFQKHARVILGLNFSEGQQIGEVLGIKPCKNNGEAVAAHAAQILGKLKIDTVVIHPTAFAAAANAGGATHVAGPYVAKPTITTGAGDHFNGGFCLGCLLGLDLAGSLQTGVATSGFYVRNAKSPTARELEKFLRSL
jgi:sugar/nucleoside kinase (ribokinase family)